MDAWMRSVAMDVAPGKREPTGDGKLMRRASGTAQNDFGRENVSGKARQRGNLYAHEFAEDVADFQVMGCDMERYVFHGLEMAAAI
jgi:hypothetical protein